MMVGRDFGRVLIWYFHFGVVNVMAGSIYKDKGGVTSENRWELVTIMSGWLLFGIWLLGDQARQIRSCKNQGQL